MSGIVKDAFAANRTRYASGGAGLRDGGKRVSTVSIIGSGGMAAAIGGLAAKAGHSVEVMSRDAAKARALAEQIGAGATAGTFGATPAGGIVVLRFPMPLFSTS